VSFEEFSPTHDFFDYTGFWNAFVGKGF